MNKIQERLYIEEYCKTCRYYHSLPNPHYEYCGNMLSKTFCKNRGEFQPKLYPTPQKKGSP